MADPLTIGLTALPTLVSLFQKSGGGPNYEKELFDFIMGELKTGEFGLSPLEQMKILESIKENLQEASQNKIGTGISSMRRRGVFSPGQVAGFTADVAGDFGQAYGKATTQVPLYSKEVGRKQKNFLWSMLPGLAKGATGWEMENRAYGDKQFGGLTSSLADLLSNVKWKDFLDKMLKQYESDVGGDSGGYFSNMQAPAFSGWPW